MICCDLVKLVIRPTAIQEAKLRLSGPFSDREGSEVVKLERFPSFLLYIESPDVYCDEVVENVK